MILPVKDVHNVISDVDFLKKTKTFSKCINTFREDWEFLVRNKALPEERMTAVETGGCPHAAIREVYNSLAIYMIYFV